MSDTPRTTSRIGLWILILLVAGQGVVWLWSTGQRWVYGRQAHDYWFDYESIDYLATNDQDMTMTSTSVWYRQIDFVVWVDVLHCETGGETAIYSSQSWEEAQFGPRDLKVVEWSYVAPFPSDGRRCEMQSTITIQDQGVSKSLRVVSDPFTP